MTESPGSAPAPETAEKGGDDQGKPTTSKDGAEEQQKAGKSADPLGAEQRGFSEEQRGFNDAFWQGHRFLAPDMFGSGPSATIGHSTFRDVQFGDRTEIFVGHTVPRTLGTVPEEVLDKVRRCYHPVREHESMKKILAERRVLLLRGQPGTGRTTTALHLLEGVAATRIFRIEGGKAISNPEKSDLPEENEGYVAQLFRDDCGSVTAEKLDKLRAVVEEQSAFCVLIGESDPREPDLFGGYVADYRAPDPEAILRNHALEVMSDDPPERGQRLADLLSAQWVRTALGPCPRPRESVRMADLLARHVRGAITQEDVERKAATAVDVQLSEWFAPLRALQAGAEHDEALHLTAFRVALAVLNESPYNLVAAAARTLGSMLITASADRETRHASLFSDDPASRLPALRAESVDGFTTFGSARVPMQLLAFQDDRYPAAILRYVWENHHLMAATVTEWLRELCTDPRPTVWVRAAQAIGFLGSLDLSEVYTKTIYPVVRSIEEEPAARLQRAVAAAVALDQAGQHERLRAAVHSKLRSWRRHGDLGERWTAAAAHGFVMEHKQIAGALEELRVLGTPSERQRPLESGDGEDDALVWMAGYSMAKLFALGAAKVVLDQLLEWITSHRGSLRSLAQSAVRHLVDFYGFELDHLHIAVGLERPELDERMRRWPLLLSVQSRNPEFTAPIAELLRLLLRREGDQVAKQYLGKWVRASEHDTELLEVLAGFVPHIVWNDGDAFRLTHLLDRLSRDWADPLDEGVVSRLREAIQSSLVGSSIG